MSEEERPFEHTAASASAKVTRGLEQGLGVGRRELDAQREPAIDPPLLDENPENDWGGPADEGATYSANATRGEKTDAERGPGPKTRTAAKDAISRR